MTTVIEPGTATAAAPLVRVVKGSLATEELAALTAVLLARAAVQSGPGASVKGGGGTGAAVGKAKGHKAQGDAQARWQRPERRPDYRSPVSWHS